MRRSSSCVNKTLYASASFRFRCSSLIKMNLFYQYLNLIYRILIICLLSTSKVEGTAHTAPGNGVTPVQNHSCDRICEVGNSMTCSYNFQIDNYYTMSKACFDCPTNVTDCYRPTCITGNGLQRLVYTVNVQMPGPIIAVCENDTINVVVENRLGGPITTIHWHGIFQKGTAFMDGVPYVTQCPINPYSKYQYKFSVHQSGTYFWHGHGPYQIMDGLAGMLVIRQPLKMDPNRDEYDEDLNEHAFMFSNWNMDTGFPSNGYFYMVRFNRTYSPPIIVNGRGQLTNFQKENGEYVYTPLSQFHVKPGSRYRFRSCNNDNSECQTIMSIDGHSMTVIATDGNPVKPYVVDAIVTGQGQRIDFVLNANHSSGNFLMRFQGYGQLNFCNQTFGAANIKYNGSPQKDLTKLYTPGDMNIPENKILSSVTNLRSLTPTSKNLGNEPDTVLYFGVGSVQNNDPLDYNPKYYPWHSFKKLYRLSRLAINGIIMTYPPSPMLTQYNEIPKKQLCNVSSLRGVENCTKDFCSCIHLEKIPLRHLTEFVIFNPAGDQHQHSFHLHGYAFRVVAQGNLTADSIAAFKRLESEGKIHRNFVAPPLVDSVSIPRGGYVIIRFVADNPGIWLFHCHMSFHFDTGMGMVIQVGEPSDFSTFPPNLPKCGNFVL